MEEGKVVVPKENKTKTTLALIVIIILFLGLLYVTFTYFTNPKKKIVDSINKFYQSYTEKMTSNKTNGIMNNNIVGLDGKLSVELNSTDEMFNNFKNIDLSYNYIEDKENKTSSLSFDSNVNNTKFLEILALSKDNKLYFNLKNLINKYYHVDFDFIELLKANETSDILYITDIFKDNLVKNITNDLFTKTSAEIDIDGKNTKTTKYTMSISNAFVNKIMRSSLNQITNDSKALEILAKYLKKETNDIKEAIEESLKNTTDNDSSVIIDYSIYVKNFISVVRHEIKMDNTVLAYQVYGDTKEYIVSSNSDTIMNIKVNTKDRTITGNLSEAKISGTYTNDTVKLSLTDGNQTLNINYTYGETLNNEEYGTNFELNISFLNGKTEIISGTIIYKNNVSKEEKIDNQDVSKSTDINEISDADAQTIMNNLIKLPIIKDFYQYYYNMLDSEESNATKTLETQYK